MINLLHFLNFLTWKYKLTSVGLNGCSIDTVVSYLCFKVFFDTYECSSQHHRGFSIVIFIVPVIRSVDSCSEPVSGSTVTKSIFVYFDLFFITVRLCDSYCSIQASAHIFYHKSLCNGAIHLLLCLNIAYISLILFRGRPISLYQRLY